MKGFKRCSNGHFYKEALPTCPHCSAGGGSADPNKTAINPAGGGGGNDLDKTQIFGQGSAGSIDGDKTQVFGAGGGSGNDAATEVFGAGAPSASGGGRDLNKTYIGGITEEDESGDAPTSAPRAARMITGWLVSFTVDPMGVDFRIYEGNNMIGRDPGNSISITNDSTISGKHANILHKKGKFWIKDEMAANGTFINGEELEIEKAYPINDGDEVRLGDTVFTFKTWH